MGKKVKEQKQEEEVEEVEEQEEVDVNTEQVERQKRTVFISGLPYSATQDDINKFFEGCGDIFEIKLPKYQDSGRCRGFAHVIFQKKKSVQKALQKDKQIMGDRYIDVKEGKGEQAKQQSDGTVPDDCTTIFIKNLSYQATEDQVGEIFENCGQINNIRFVYHPTEGHFKGFGYIDFNTKTAVIRALKLNGTEINGRKVFVDFEVGKQKAGFRVKENDTNKYNQQSEDISQKKQIKKKKIDKVNNLKDVSSKKR